MEAQDDQEALREDRVSEPMTEARLTEIESRDPHSSVYARERDKRELVAEVRRLQEERKVIARAAGSPSPTSMLHVAVQQWKEERDDAYHWIRAALKEHPGFLPPVWFRG